MHENSLFLVEDLCENRNFLAVLTTIKLLATGLSKKGFRIPWGKPKETPQENKKEESNKEEEEKQKKELEDKLKKEQEDKLKKEQEDKLKKEQEDKLKKVDLHGGFFVEPTIVEIDHKAEIVKTELFVPILYVIKCHSLEEAISINNEVPQGLSSSLFTTNMQSV